MLTGAEADLTKLPIPTYSPDDGGPFITPGIVVSRDPETGVPDIGHYRFQIMNAGEMSFLAQPFHRFGKHIVKARQMGMTRYPAAVVFGVDPILAYTCTIQVPDGTNDFEIAGGLRGAPVELVHARTVDLDVPAHSEIVIEFEVDLTKDVFEGPLGEYTGYYTPASMKPLARVTAITHRTRRVLSGAADRRAADRKPHPQAAAVRSVVLPDDEEAVSDAAQRFDPAVGRRVVFDRDVVDAALRGRSAPRDPGGARDQPAAEDRHGRRSRHQRAEFGRSRVGGRLPRAAAARRDHRR